MWTGWMPHFMRAQSSSKQQWPPRAPKAVGFYGHTITRPRMRELVQHSVAQGCRVMAGGPDPVQYLDEYFDMGVEVVVIGEGEHTLLELMQHLKAQQLAVGLGELHSGEWDCISTRGTRLFEPRPGSLIRPIDCLPWPERRRKDLAPYLDAWRERHGETALSMVTSRGCPYHCSWCSKQVYGDTFRRRSVDDVIDELLHLKAEYNPDQIWFADDLFTINKAWIRRFCAEMVRREAVTYFTSSGVQKPLPRRCAMISKRRAAFGSTCPPRVGLSCPRCHAQSRPG